MLEKAGVSFSHYFSIIDHLEANNVAIEWRNGLPYADEAKWNHAKRDYCKAQGIDLMFDDSPTYLETFHDIDSIYGMWSIGSGRYTRLSDLLTT